MGRGGIHLRAKEFAARRLASRRRVLVGSVLLQHDNVMARLSLRLSIALAGAANCEFFRPGAQDRRTGSRADGPAAVPLQCARTCFYLSRLRRLHGRSSAGMLRSDRRWTRSSFSGSAVIASSPPSHCRRSFISSIIPSRRRAAYQGRAAARIHRPGLATARYRASAQKEGSHRSSRGTSAPVCAYALESGSSTFGAEGGKGRVSVRTNVACAWTARSDFPWITLRVASGTGPGDIEYDVAPDAGTDQRQAAISVEQASFPVRQDPPSPTSCSYNVDPTSTSLHWHGAVGEGFDVRLATAAHCTWTTVAAASWIELLTAPGGTGSTVMRVRVGAYTEQQTRRAPLEIRWPTATAGQTWNVSTIVDGRLT